MISHDVSLKYVCIPKLQVSILSVSANGAECYCYCPPRMEMFLSHRKLFEGATWNYTVDLHYTRQSSHSTRKCCHQLTPIALHDVSVHRWTTALQLAVCWRSRSSGKQCEEDGFGWNFSRMVCARTTPFQQLIRDNRPHKPVRYNVTSCFQ